MSSPNTRQFLPKTAIHLFLSWGCSLGRQRQTGPLLLSGSRWWAKSRTHPLPEYKFGAVQVNFGAVGRGQHRHGAEETARWSQHQTWQRPVPNCAARHTGRCSRQAAVCSFRRGKSCLGCHSHSWIPRPIFVGLNHIFLF